jgi:hypothetical protein
VASSPGSVLDIREVAKTWVASRCNLFPMLSRH